MSALLVKPRHAKPRELPGARAVLVPVVLMGAGGSALGGLAVSASAAEKPLGVTVAGSSPQPTQAQATLLAERVQEVQQRASRQRAVEAAAAAEAARVAAEQAAAAEAARVAAEQAAAAEAARVAAEQAAMAKAEEDARNASKAARPGTGRLTSAYGPRWGRMHRGLDLAAGTGAPIRAAAAGTVVSAGPEGGYGRAIRIRHADGSETLYAHNSRLLVRDGQRVAAGEQIAREGATGNVTGPHLHFEVRVGGRNVNPMTWLRQRGVMR